MSQSSHSPIPPKLVMKLKKKTLCDEYILTTRHIVCKFRYLVMCFDHLDETQPTAGLIMLPTERLKELISEQGLLFESKMEGDFFWSALTTLKEWHPLISKIHINGDHLEKVSDLTNYPLSWESVQPYLTKFKDNRCLRTANDFETFKNYPHHNVITIEVSFQLIKAINKIEDYRVNFRYCHKLLTQCLMDRLDKQPIDLDEVSVTCDALPFSNPSIKEDPDRHYVFPQMYLLPLYSITG